jgi:small subunit ribosomal protein S8
MSNYILSDMVSRLKVATRNHFVSVKVKYTVLCLNVLNLLYKNGFIYNIKIVDNDQLIIFLKYYQNRPVFYSIDIISTPGKRVFWTLGKLSLKYSKLNFSGFYIISTSKGLVTSNDCLLGQSISGEVLLKINV